MRRHGDADELEAEKLAPAKSPISQGQRELGSRSESLRRDLSRNYGELLPKRAFNGRWPLASFLKENNCARPTQAAPSRVLPRN